MLADKLAGIKGVPLAARLIFTQGASQTVEAGAGVASESTTTVNFQVKSVSEAALDEVLFSIPADYKEVPNK